MKKEHFIPILLAAAMIVVLFADVFLGHKAIFKDQAYEFHYQGAVYAKDELSQGDFPLWNRRAAMGEPFAAYPEYSLFYPLFFPLTLVFPPVLAVNLLILLQYLIIAGFTAALARRLGVSAEGALVSAISFAFSGYLLFLHTELQNLIAVSALPASLYFFERYRSSANPANVIAAGLALGIGHLGGGTQYSYYVDLLFVLWALFVSEKTDRPYREMAKNGVAAIVAAIISVAFAAILLLPAAMMAKSSIRSSIDYEHAAHSPKGPEDRGYEIGAKDLPGFVYPKEPGMSPAQSKPVHVGMVVLVLALIGLWHGQGRKRYWILGIAILTLFLAFGKHTPVYRIFYALPIPGMGMFKNPIRIIVIGVFCISILAGYGLDAFMKGRGKYRLLYFGILSCALFFTAGFAFRESSIYPGTFAVILSIGFLFSAISVPADKEKIARAMVLLGVMVGMIAAYPILDLLPMEEVKKRIEETPITRAIKADATGRTATLGPKPSFGMYNRFDLVENTGMARGIDLVGGNTSLHSARYLWFTSSGEDVGPVQLYGLKTFLEYPSLAKMANVEYLVRPLDAPRTGRLVAHSAKNALEKIDTPGPVRMVEAWICADNVDDAREKLKTLRYQKEAPYIDIIEDIGCKPGQAAGLPVSLASRTADRMEIKIAKSGAGYLFISEGYDSRWQATLNENTKAKIVPANLGFMAVVIPEGDVSSVVLEYHPADFVVGASVSAFAFAFCIGIIASMAVATRRLARKTKA